MRQARVSPAGSSTPGRARPRRIAVITGTRSDYGPMRPVLRAIQAAPELELCLIVTGMHLSAEYGSSVRDIERDGFAIARRISMLFAEDSGYATAKGIGVLLTALAQAFEELTPDVVLLQGDRGEMLAAAIAAAHANIAIVHMSGGDTSGTIDDATRHALTKLSHLHLVTCEASAARVLALGESRHRVQIVGEPTLDAIRTLKRIPPAELAKRFQLDLDRPVILAIQHAVTDEVHAAAAQARETMAALEESGAQVIVGYPNSDAGGRAIGAVLKEYDGRPQFRFIRSEPHEVFLSLMAMASVLVGNTSSGIIEAPSFKLPVVNVGTRQRGRTRAMNVLDVGHDRNEIAAAIHTALHDQRFRNRVNACVNPYGDGHCAEKTAGILSRMELGPSLTAKWLDEQPRRERASAAR